MSHNGPFKRDSSLRLYLFFYSFLPSLSTLFSVHIQDIVYAFYSITRYSKICINKVEKNWEILLIAVNIMKAEGQNL